MLHETVARIDSRWANIFRRACYRAVVCIWIWFAETSYIRSCLTRSPNDFKAKAWTCWKEYVKNKSAICFLKTWTSCSSGHRSMNVNSLCFSNAYFFDMGTGRKASEDVEISVVSLTAHLSWPNLQTASERAHIWSFPVASCYGRWIKQTILSTLTCAQAFRFNEAFAYFVLTVFSI